MTAGETPLPGDTVLEPLSRGHWGGPLAASVVGLPVLHYGLYSVGWLDEATRPAREAWMVLSLVLLATGGTVYYRRLVEENRALWIQSQAAIDRLQASERLEALGRLAGGIAHDFNNVLAVIMGNADLAQASMTSDDPETHGHLESVIRAAERGADLVKNLLGFGRRDLVAAKPTDLQELAGRLTHEWSRVMPENVKLSFHGSPDTPTVLVDASVFESVVVNLITNARDSMPLGGRVDIATRAQVVTAEDARSGAQPGVYGCLEVRDAGVGMDNETLARVFEPFFTTKPVGEGAGMGLSMVYGIVKQHSGLIEVESAPDRGTVVTICLPISDESPAPVRVEQPEQPDVVVPGTETILLVEDEAAVRRVAAALLESHGFAVFQAGDGIEAMELFEQRQDTIDLVLSDLMMPRMGGIELFEQIRGVPSDVPFMFVSGYAPDVHRGRELHPTVPFVAKPWRSEELLAEVRRSLDGAR
jgi:signal transduction histidine kinase/CheY-like chemotaxis protein